MLTMDRRRRRPATLTIIALFVCLAPVEGQSIEEIRNTVFALEVESHQEWLNGNVSMLNDLMAQEFHFVVMNGAVETKEHVVCCPYTGTGPLRVQGLNVVPETFALRGDVAIVISLMELDATARGVSNAHSPCPWPGPARFLTDRASPPDSTMLQVGAHTLKLCYSRPQARGRPIFGHLVPFDRPWRTGANEPTILHLPARASVGGVPLEAGTYVLITIPSKDSWTILFNTSTASEPMEMFTALTEVARVEVPVETAAEHIETLTIRGEPTPLPSLVIEWERTRVRVLIESDLQDGRGPGAAGSSSANAVRTRRPNE